jgi:hypothetical protein
MSTNPNYSIPESTRRFTHEELAKCARRELAHRKRLYYRWCLEGRMDRDDAAAEIAMMKQIAEFFEEKTNPKLL